jgi:hypothetical protein
LDQVQNICNELQQQCNPVAATLENCAQAKECIVQYLEHIRQQVKEEDELFKEHKVQLGNKEEHLKQQGWSPCNPHTHRSEVPIVVTAFFDVALCSLVDRYQCFKDASCISLSP